MTVTFPTWMSHASAAIRRLAEQPWALFALLLAMNAIGRPCSVTAHDARLYSLQTLNQAEHGAYADDVFLSYGSQDQFSLFSRLAGPLVAVLGLRLAFFSLYLVFNTLFILALFRFVRALVPDTLTSTLALIFLVTAPLSYGGHDIFMVHEQFFTPRLPGTTLTLFALERLLSHRPVTAFFLLLAGCLVHPLMAFGGVLIWVGFVAYSWLPWRAFVCLFATSVIGLATILCIPALATQLFGVIDDEWHQMIRLAVGYNYPDTWVFKDWINLGVSFAVPIAACVVLYRDDPLRRRFCFVVVLAGTLGFFTTLAASFLPYALLFQGQPYRVLWILKVVQVALGFFLIVRWSQSTVIYARLAAAALVAFFCVVNYNGQEIMIIVFMLVVSLCFYWVSEASEGLPYALARGFVLGALGWAAYRWWFLFSHRETISEHFDLNEWILGGFMGTAILMAVFITAAVWLGQLLNLKATAWACSAVAILVPTAFFATEFSPTLRQRNRLGDDIAFVQDFVQQRASPSREIPSIYCSLGRPDLIWIDVKATSYFDILQTAGVMFNRRTAEEIRRRITLVNKFELERQRRESLFLSEDMKIGTENLLGLKFDSPAPTRDDLARLCGDSRVDYIVIPQEFPGLSSASNGRIYIYECRKVRTTLP